MSEPDKQQFGDGGDQWGEAARNLANAAKELGKEGVKSAASGTAAGVANSSAALVKAGVEGGKAVSEIAAGTAAGGPWGAVLSTAWSLRHTLYKILVCICLFFLILIVLLTSLPTIVTNQVFGLNGADMANPLTLSQSMTRLSGVVADTLEAAHQAALERVNDLIAEGGYDQELSLEALDDQAGDSSYDVAYVLCAYSVSMEQLGTSQEDMTRKLSNLADKLFPVTYEVKTAEVQVEQDTSSEGEENSSSSPQTQTVSYLAATIHPLNQDAILEAFQLDPEAAYGDFSITCGEAITNMATALKLTLYGSIREEWAEALVPARAGRRWQPSPCPRWGRWEATPIGVGTAFPAGWSGAPVLSPGAMPRWGFPSPGFPAAPREAWPGSNPTASGGIETTPISLPGTLSSSTGMVPATPTMWALWWVWTKPASTPWRATPATMPATIRATSGAVP